MPAARFSSYHFRKMIAQLMRDRITRMKRTIFVAPVDCVTSSIGERGMTCPSCTSANALNSVAPSFRGSAQLPREPLKGFPQAFGQRAFRSPAEDLTCLGHLDERFLLLAGPVRSDLDRHVAARRFLQDARNLDHARSLAGADVETTGVETASRRQWFRGGKPDCTRDVTDIDVVAGLQAIAEDRQWLVVEDAPAENGD